MRMPQLFRRIGGPCAGLIPAFCLMAGEPLAISRDGRIVAFDISGAIRSMSCRGKAVLWPVAGKAGEVEYGGKNYALDQPVGETGGERADEGIHPKSETRNQKHIQREGNVPTKKPGRMQSREAMRFRYRLETEPSVEVEVETSVAVYGRSGLILRREVVLRCGEQLNGPVTVRLTALPEGLGRRWLPLKNGVGRWTTNGTSEPPVYLLAGPVPAKGQRLALPLVGAAATEGKLDSTIMADPFFSTVFAGDTVAWTHPADPGLENGEERHVTLTVLGAHKPEEAMDTFYQQILPEIQPGPEWLHRIALVDYDYLSDGGKGWARDMRALAAAIPKADRGRVFVCLHGWYDWIGRYCYNTATGKLDPTWTAFGSYPLVSKNHSRANLEGTQVDVGFDKCVPAPMSLATVHQRLALARSQGFRVGMYFADGMNSADGLPDFTPDKVLRWGGWGGPDMKGKTYAMNPLHPWVRAFYLGYMRALLEEFGQDLDALNWDETFHIRAGDLGNAAYHGHADRAMMRLTRELTLLVQDWNHRHHRQLAFLTSDAIGPFAGTDTPPYGLYAHGTYQDSHCNPAAWPYGIFPNLRNVLWSCCWWPVSKWDWVEFGARSYQAPVSISNGWGDNIGFAEAGPEFRQKVIELFNWRKRQTTRLRWFETLPIPPKK